MAERYLETGNGQIFYRKGGEGPPLLLLHGNGEDSSLFQALYPFFLDHFSVLAMDTRGHGLSELGQGKLTFSSISQDILGILAMERVSAVHVIGYSDGGNIGLYLAARYPAAVSSLIVLGANFEAEGLLEESYQEILQEREQLLELLDEEGTHRRLQILNLMLDELALSEADLKQVQAPVLVMAGEYDLIKEEQTRRLAASLPDARLQFVAGGGHGFFLDQPGALKQAAKQFYQQIAVWRD